MWGAAFRSRASKWKYIFIVDGKWLEDPQNPSKAENEYDSFNSVIDVQKNIAFRLCDFEDAKTFVINYIIFVISLI